MPYSIVITPYCTSSPRALSSTRLRHFQSFPLLRDPKSIKFLSAHFRVLTSFLVPDRYQALTSSIVYDSQARRLISSFRRPTSVHSFSSEPGTKSPSNASLPTVVTAPIDQILGEEIVP